MEIKVKIFLNLNIQNEMSRTLVFLAASHRIAHIFRALSIFWRTHFLKTG